MNADFFTDKLVQGQEYLEKTKKDIQARFAESPGNFIASGAEVIGIAASLIIAGSNPQLALNIFRGTVATATVISAIGEGMQVYNNQEPLSQAFVDVGARATGPMLLVMVERLAGGDVPLGVDLLALIAGEGFAVYTSTKLANAAGRIHKALRREKIAVKAVTDLVADVKSVADQLKDAAASAETSLDSIEKIK